VEWLDSLIEAVRRACAGLPDGRAANRHFTMEDIGMAAFSVFFMQSRRFWPISGGCVKVKAVRTARPCSR